VTTGRKQKMLLLSTSHRGKHVLSRC